MQSLLSEKVGTVVTYVLVTNCVTPWGAAAPPPALLSVPEDGPEESWDYQHTQGTDPSWGHAVPAQWLQYQACCSSICRLELLLAPAHGEEWPPRARLGCLVSLCSSREVTPDVAMSQPSVLGALLAVAAVLWEKRLCRLSRGITPAQLCTASPEAALSTCWLRLRSSLTQWPSLPICCYRYPSQQGGNAGPLQCCAPPVRLQCGQSMESGLERRMCRCHIDISAFFRLELATAKPPCRLFQWRAYISILAVPCMFDSFLPLNAMGLKYTCSENGSDFSNKCSKFKILFHCLWGLQGGWGGEGAEGGLGNEKGDILAVCFSVARRKLPQYAVYYFFHRALISHDCWG